MSACYGKSTHFSLLGLEERFDINGSDVDAAFKELQRQLHPDKFSQATKEELALAEAHSSKVNEAVRILRSPLFRAQYWMELQGVRVLEEDQRMEDMETMMEVMETSEQLEQAQTKKEVASIARVVDGKMRGVEVELIGILSARDWLTARQRLERLQMLDRLRLRLNDWQEQSSP